MELLEPNYGIVLLEPNYVNKLWNRLLVGLYDTY
jgi:hypothetical protein